MRQQGRLPFEYEVEAEADNVTAFGGLPIVAEAMAAFGVDESVKRHVKLGRAPRKFGPADITRALVLMMAAGGDCLDDLERLREDEALCRLLGKELPSPETVRQALYEFHSDLLVEEAARKATEAGRKAYVPEETAPLKGLGAVIRDLTAAIQRRWPKEEATLDIDATVQDSNKREAKFHYLGRSGYQPVVATWVEQDLVVFDEFRDGNVNASMDSQDVVKRSFAALPEGVKVRRCRGDSALYGEQTVTWLASERIEFALGMKLNKDFEMACAALPEDKWQFLESRPETDLHAAWLDYAPAWAAHVPGVRYLAIRMTPHQQELFGSREVVYLGLVTNRPGEAADVVRWYWEKAGTVEQVHDVVKNELGGGVLPCGRFGANAAWFRICILTHNVLRIVREIGPEDLRKAHPKRLRFNLFAIPATVVTHARKLVARLGRRLRRAEQLLGARLLLWTATASA